ncbi:MAG: hypothetical protein RXS23_03090 [Metallosphaera yellowstonensis]|jgi:hypothetical protein|uniref:Uncharacterized protein n=1 Tax=Metallosphaera yellowstonensis MK1 TaxID=671065 RepID=H2C722_9CREN|nr:hypothetical protein [Metallosphaera yellowstonensis]EHP69599.1 hypothetical protein MetMK1DRAFT_00023690 [Metallosphaera yellowstonensis MK1]
MSEARVKETLTKFEEVIDNHSANLGQLENMLAINVIDLDRCHRLLKRIRRTRREIYEGMKTIVENIGGVVDRQTREESIGIISYLGMVGLKDELELLKGLQDVMKKNGESIDINDDVKQIMELMDMASKLSF